MFEHELRLQKPLEEYVEFWEKMNKRSLALLPELVVPGFAFCDPYHNVSGVDAACSLLKHRFEVFKGGRYHVYDFMWGRRQLCAYVHWSFTFQPRKKMFRPMPNDLVIGGMSKIMFLDDGKVLSHEDFFAAHHAIDLKAYSSLTL